MNTLRKIRTNDGRFLTLLTEDGPVTAEADNPGALNQIWDIPNISGIDSTMQNLGYQNPEPYAGLGADGATIVGGQQPIEWNFISAGGHSFIQQVGSDLTWTSITPGVGSAVRDHPTICGRQIIALFLMNRWRWFPQACKTPLNS
ncbi:hypothetical protein PAXRUDRAFT_835163 [Paxillus rubicundulus Ve08.2h10]|uniref:Uncharacterized protein n=1 Tax=Paxillus rubicundulus Ve08.2h10 TaxID=930991 RepID=A0A0D0CNX9_9AGAM|nr:hypothetical protein PAXRUDRAFT_835163 [Paxillus rubicundulus Ve08.2h10]